MIRNFAVGVLGVGGVAGRRCVRKSRVVGSICPSTTTGSTTTIMAALRPEVQSKVDRALAEMHRGVRVLLFVFRDFQFHILQSECVGVV